MVKVVLDEYFDVYEYIQKINNVKFEDLDLSDFFANADDDTKKKIVAKITKYNNFNRIFLLVAYENLREEFGLILTQPPIEESDKK